MENGNKKEGVIFKNLGNQVENSYHFLPVIHMGS